LHYGWVVVGVTFFTLLTTAGAMSTPSVMLEPLQKEFGWSTATISVALSVRMAVVGVAFAIAGSPPIRSKPPEPGRHRERVCPPAEVQPSTQPLQR
jgi:hypothetical protein